MAPPTGSVNFQSMALCAVSLASTMSHYLRPLEVQEKLAVAFAPVDRRVGQAMHL